MSGWPVRRAAPLFIGVVVCLIGLSREASGQDVGVVSGQVVDASNGEPVSGVLVQIAGTIPFVSNGEGYFVLRDVPAGAHALEVSHIGYGDHAEFIAVQADRELSLTVRMSPQAIELERFVVEVSSELEERRRSSGNSVNEIQREEIEAAARTGMGLTDLLQTSMPGAMASQTGRATSCVQYRAIRTGGTSACREVSVVLDGVQVASPAYIYQTLPLSDIERIEMMSPGQAGLRYGMAAGQGVLVIETKRGEVRQRSDLSRFVTGFQWVDETAPYRWSGVLGKSAVTNALLVAAALSLSENCFFSPEVGSLGLRTRCNGFHTASLGVLSVGLPAIVGGYVANRSGESITTRGRIAPTALAAGMILTGGYLLVIQGGDVSRTAGYAVLAGGVPVTLALADRIFRVLLDS